MRVISGEAKGRRLKTPADGFIRPTADRAKETLFDIIGAEVPGAMVLDLFAGTGNLGIEALSRGARAVFFVDSDRRAVAVIRKNLDLVNGSARSTVWQADAFSSLARLQRMRRRFNLVFCDPPYDQRLAERSLEALVRRKLVAEHGMVIMEHHRKEVLPPRVADLMMTDQRRFGDSLLTFFRQKAEP